MKSIFSIITIILSLSFFSSCTNKTISPETQNKTVINTLFTEFYNGHNLDILDKLVLEEYKEHNPEISGGRLGMKDFFGKLFTQFPEFKSQPKRMVAEGNLVLVHSQNTINKADYGNDFAKNSQSVIDVFRLEEGKIAEHWEAIQNVNPNTINGNSMFNGTTFKVQSEEQEARNKKIAEDYFNELFNKGNFDYLDQIMVEDFKAHNPMEPNGREPLKQALSAMMKSMPGKPTITNVFRVAEGNLVFSAHKFALEGFPVMDGFNVDILAFNEAGKIIEHWDILTALPPENPEINQEK